MSKQFYVMSDPHFGHVNILTFNREDGTPLRDFETIEEMDQTIVDNWNKVVRDVDQVYMLGDIAMHHRCLPILDRLKGTKVLVRGNHDTGKLSQYSKYYKDIRGCAIRHKCIMTHIPIHPQCMSRWKLNIHGHLHSNNITTKEGWTEHDTRYVCVCVEQIDYTPVNLEQLVDERT